MNKLIKGMGSIQLLLNSSTSFNIGKRKKERKKKTPAPHERVFRDDEAKTLFIIAGGHIMFQF